MQDQSGEQLAEIGMQDKQLAVVGTRRLAEVGMQDISSHFQVSDYSIRTSLVQIGHDISDIKD